MNIVSHNIFKAIGVNICSCVKDVFEENNFVNILDITETSTVIFSQIFSFKDNASLRLILDNFVLHHPLSNFCSFYTSVIPHASSFQERIDRIGRSNITRVRYYLEIESTSRRVIPKARPLSNESFKKKASNLLEYD